MTRSRVNTPEFVAGFDRIFGGIKRERGSWVQDSETGKLVPKNEFTRAESKAPAIHGSPEAFISPVDRTVIDDRRKLREHNKRHGVTNVRDYGEDYFERRGKEKYLESIGATKEAKAERIAALKEAFGKHGI